MCWSQFFSIFPKSGDRTKQKHYQAWQVINTAQGKGGSGGRVEALALTQRRRHPPARVDVLVAFLQGINLAGARLLRANFNATDLRDGDFLAADFTDADLRSANLRGSNLQRATFRGADLSDSDLSGANLAQADLSGANLDNADLQDADLRECKWRNIAHLKKANIEAGGMRRQVSLNGRLNKVRSGRPITVQRKIRRAQNKRIMSG